MLIFWAGALQKQTRRGRDLTAIQGNCCFANTKHERKTKPCTTNTENEAIL